MIIRYWPADQDGGTEHFRPGTLIDTDTGKEVISRESPAAAEPKEQGSLFDPNKPWKDQLDLRGMVRRQRTANFHSAERLKIKHRNE